MLAISFELRHITYTSPESDKREIIRVWDARGGPYAALTCARLHAPFGQERYGMAAAFVQERCVGTTAYILSPRGQGILTQVYTDPDYRGRGIAKATVAETVRRLREQGARAVYLAAWQDWIRAIYQKAGFEFVGAMGERHAFKLTLDDTGRDGALFRPDQRLTLRPLSGDDQADLCALFNARHDAVVKHYELGCYLGSHFEAEFFTLRNHKGHTALVLDGEETLLGLATAMPSMRRHETHCGTVDLLVHPNYADRSADLLNALETTCDIRILNAYIAPSEQAKRDLFENAGYRRTAHMENRLQIDTRTFDLDLYTKQRPSS